MKDHFYTTQLQWTGNTGKGTDSYRGYERSHEISADGKPSIHCSSDPSFRGDRSKYNPEEMFVASLSSCHMLWFLHACAEAGIIVQDYADSARGTMLETDDGNGRFKEVVLYPRVRVTEQWMIEKVDALHEKAHQFCFIANSCNFPVRHEAVCYV